MKVTFKTLDQRSFEMEVGAEEGVEDLICKMEDKLGQENLYRLIYAGKMMHEGEMVSDYKMTGKLPVVVMVTKLENFRKQEREAEEGPKAKRVRTESEDSGFGDEEGDHFVTDREFSIALEVVMTCQHFRRPSELVSVEEMQQMVEDMFPDEEEVRRIICSRLEQVEEVNPTKEQFKAFALDIQSMYQEGRVLPPSVEVEREEAQNNYMDEDDEEEEEVGLVERNLRTMIGMGFAKEDAEEALSRSSGSLQVALDLLLPRGPATPPSPTLHPKPHRLPSGHPWVPVPESGRDAAAWPPSALAHQVTSIEHFSPLYHRLILCVCSFGQSHPEVMRTIHENRETFVAMLYEQTGGATSRYARHHWPTADATTRNRNC